MAEKKMKVKKEKKSKLSESEVREDELIKVDPPSLEIVPNSNSNDHDLHKDKKKKKKKSSQEETTVEEHNASIESSKDEKKKKKRKNNEQEEVQESQSGTNENSELKSDEKPKKKKKRQNENSNTSPSLGNYIPHPDVENMSTSTAESYRQEHGLTMLPTEFADFYKPITSFAQLTPSLQDYCPEVLQYLEAKKFPNPSPIQVTIPTPHLT
jgi:hypothetical protein